ncbi:hypothetical protein IG631_01006 [Alternaria alternata]|nr:hypothetical protein IG631_01006 [Alternaria alternata]
MVLMARLSTYIFARSYVHQVSGYIQEQSMAAWLWSGVNGSRVSRVCRLPDDGIRSSTPRRHHCQPRQERLARYRIPAAYGNISKQLPG